VPSFYSAGQDVTNIADPKKSHLQFLGRVIQEFEALSTIFSVSEGGCAGNRFGSSIAEIRQKFMTAERRPWGEWNTEAVMAWLSARAGAPNGETGKEEE